MHLELLESRLTPTAFFTYTDVDGDPVTVTTSRGTNADLAAILVFSEKAGPRQLQTIDFAARSAVFAGTDLTVTTTGKPIPGGNSSANVGYIHATGTDLGAIRIRGDLGRIDAGDAVRTTPAVAGLT